MAQEYFNSGALFKNDRKEPGSKQPDYRARITIDRETMKAIAEAGGKVTIAGWVREGNKGKFISLLVSADTYEKPSRDMTPRAAQQQAQDDDFDQDIPF